MHNLIVPYFFFTNNTGAPQRDTLDRMKPLSTKSCSWVFNSFNSIGAILYDDMEIGAEPGNTSIPNSSSLSGGNPDKSSEKNQGTHMPLAHFSN